MKNALLSRFTVCICVIFNIFSLINTSVGVSIDYHNATLTRIPRQTRCDGFKCTTTGECLDEEKRCDGTVDCKDGSDEFNDCKESVQCPGYVFTCDYGACIDKTKRCNGEKDCRDNSDEANCLNTENVQQVSSNCKSDQFQCKSGQCIHQDDKCNGKSDCEDNSDETKETCLNMQCPGWTFKCDYGACVDGFAKCNNIKDCVDNSDELDCGTVEVQTPAPPPLEPFPSNSAQNCILPEHPQFGQWSIYGSDLVKNPSQKVLPSTTLTFRCNDGYKISKETNFAVCLGSVWNPPEFPTCLKKCKALYTTSVTKIRCFNPQKIEIKCDEATHGTTATFECERYHEPSDRSKATRYCHNGTWNLPEPVCKPVCGEKEVTATPLIVNGQHVKKGNYPWVTAIYHQLPNGTYLNVCGGSMLTQRIILTAAHCVADDYGHLRPIENIIVAVGKYYRQYRDDRDTQAQYSKLKKIEIPDKYKGDSQRFASDIAVLVTEDVLLLSKVVQPVCYHNIPNLHLNPTMKGVITGWGYTIASGQPSEELREINVPYKQDSECWKELPTDWADKYYTYDKMCAGHYNRSIAVCQGDSGGGLVFLHDKRYFVHGIVSVGHGYENGCNIQVSSLYTKVSTHFEWLDEKVNENSFI